MDDPSKGTQGSQDVNRKGQGTNPQRSGGTDKPDGGKTRREGMEEEE